MAETVLAATTVLNTVVDFASKVQMLGENYYKASAEWEDFPLKVQNLHNQGEVWLAAYTKYGISDKGLIDSLQQASSLLQAEEEKLSKRKKSNGTEYARLARCCAKAHVVAFPSEIGVRIRRVEAAFTNIQNLLKLKEDVKVGGERELLNRTYSLMFKQDERYVPLDDTEGQIYSALENSAGFIVVLLYGGPGRGKSCLARNVALHYNNLTKENSQATQSALFDQVVFLECGPKAEISAQQQLLLQHLGLNRISSVEDRQATPDISQLLIGALQSRKILIIFDDVWDDLFLQQMIDICGDNVRFLVTSQIRDLCLRLNCPSLHKIQIQEISPDVGKKILAGHLRFPNQCIQNDQIQDIADKMIEDTRGNPLALASVVSAIEETRRDSPEAWEEAYNDLQQLLKTEDTARMFGQEYGPRSFWSATKLSIQSLRKEVQSLLVLVHLCKGPYVPEEVIRFLVGRINLLEDGATFRTLANQLEGRELVKINATLTVNSDKIPEKSWSTHSLQKNFMDRDREMREQKGKLFESLLTMDPKPSAESKMSTESLIALDEDAMVTRVICALYFDDQFAERAGSPLSIANDGLKVQRRQAFEPLTRLLGTPPSDRWTPAAQTAVKQVFVKYFCQSELDDENISLLLKMTTYPSAQFATLVVIADIHIVEKTPLLNENSRVLTGLVTFLHNNATPKFQLKAASALWELLNFEGETNKLTILMGKRVLAAFLTVLVKDNNPSLQRLAASYLANLAGQGESAHLKILNQEGSLAGLVRSLGKDLNPGLQKNATCALMNLATGQELAKLQILNQKGSLAGLIKCLSKDSDKDLQKCAALALQNLSNGHPSLSDTILKEEGALEALVCSISNDDNPDLQERAAAAMANLAAGWESAKIRILNQEGALAALVTSLAKDHNPGLQTQAAWAVKNLAFGRQLLCDTILKEEGALEGLVHSISLSKDGNPSLQEQAAGAFVNLAAGEESTKLQILYQEGALSGLVRCLSKDDNPTLQHYAAWALENLANGPESPKLKILEEEAAVVELVKCVSKHNNPALQKHARGALQNLSAEGE